jgi:hypothetical protein
MRQLLYLLAMFALIGIPFCDTHAAAPSATPAAAKHTVISTISADSITIDTGKFTKSYKITERTQFIYNGTNVTLSEIKQGMRVSVTPMFDNRTAAVVIAGDAPTKAAR